MQIIWSCWSCLWVEVTNALKTALFILVNPSEVVMAGQYRACDSPANKMQCTAIFLCSNALNVFTST